MPQPWACLFLQPSDNFCLERERPARITHAMLSGVPELARYELSVYCAMEDRGCHDKKSVLQLGGGPW